MDRSPRRENQFSRSRRYARRAVPCNQRQSQQLQTFDSADQTFTRRFMMAILAGFLVLILLGLAGVWALRQAERQDELVLHTLTVENALHRLTGLNERMENARRGFLLSSDDRFRQRMVDVADETEGLSAELASLTADNPPQRGRVDRLHELSQAQAINAQRSVAAFSADAAQDPGGLFVGDDGLAIIMEIRALAAETIAEERALLDVRSREQEGAQRLAYAILATALILLIAVAAGTIWMARRNVGELRASRNVLRGMNEMLEGAVQVRTADLQRANAEIQRFAYIVSHDLRSPLVNVMGFTSELDTATGELRDLLDRAEEAAPQIVTQEARLAIREDLPEAIGFIRSSTQKMDRLINAILRLSREGRRVISPETLDMDALVSGVVDSLQHRLGEIDSTVTIERPLPVIVCDPVAIEQIFSNLIENAVKYRKPGQPVHVTVRGRKMGTRILFEIEDDGRGIDPKDHERVFDLFRRSGQQDRPGEGIGLAHVRAMAYRLGGSVSCQSALDEGATFRLSIPETFEGNQEG